MQYNGPFHAATESEPAGRAAPFRRDAAWTGPSARTGISVTTTQASGARQNLETEVFTLPPFSMVFTSLSF